MNGDEARTGTARLAWIVRNPSARRAPSESRLRAAAEPLRRRGWQVEIRSTGAPGDAESVTREALASGASTVVAAGGDGTIHEVANALSGSDGALAVIACGTANVWAREMRLPASPERALALVASGWRARLDLGEVDLGQGRGARRFLLMTGAGLDGSIVRSMHGRRIAKRLGGRAAFGPAIVGRALGARPLPVRITAGGREFERELWQAVAGNTRSYAGVLELTADARADDGALDLLLLSGGGRRRQASLIARSLRGALHRRHAPGIDYLRHRAFAIALGAEASAPLEVQADGEPLGTVAPGGELRLRALSAALVAVLPRRATPLLASRPATPRGPGGRG